MKILVTGANGYLGQGIVKQLLDDGYEVVVSDICGDYIDKRATVFCEDLFSVEDPYERYEQPDILLHLAWRDGFVHSSMNHINDLPDHIAFLIKMLEGGVKQLAVMGSMHEIGLFEGSINENTACNPQSLYGISKNTLRRILEIECAKRDVLFQWLRGFYIVGTSKRGSSIFAKIVRAAEEGKREFPFTLGLNQFDFLDYGLFCKYVADTVEQQEVDGIINICSGRPEKLADRVERFIQENGFDIELKYGTFPDRPYDSKAIWGDAFKLRVIEKMKGREK